MIQNLESIRADYEARIAALEAERDQLIVSLGSLAFEVKCLKGVVEQYRVEAEA